MGVNFLNVNCIQSRSKSETRKNIVYIAEKEMSQIQMRT